jgi:hypothetical protein
MNHTKEPWEVFEWDDSQSAIHFMSVVSKLTGEMVAAYLPIADAKRIVACVNACEGITNDVLEEGLIEKALVAYFGTYDRNVTWNGMKVWGD